MNIFKIYSLKEKLRLCILSIICLIFCIYTTTLIISSKDFYTKLTFLVIMVVFIFVTIWSEYLKFIYQSSIYFLNIELNPYKSMELFKKLNKLDFFKSYSKTFLIFEILYNMLMENYKKCIEIVDKNTDFFSSSLDNLLIKKYTYFFCNYKLNNTNKTNQYYNELENLKNAKLKHSLISPLYNWEFIDAVYFKSNNDLIKSKKAFENTNTINMNNRELLHYFSEYYDLLLRLNLKNESKDIKDKLKKLRGDVTIENKQKNN